METTAFHLRVGFSNYEKSYLIEHLNSYLAKVKRYDPSMNVDTPSMTSNHDLLQFESTPETNIQAFQLFQLKIDLIMPSIPRSCIFLSNFKILKKISQTVIG